MSGVLRLVRVAACAILTCALAYGVGDAFAAPATTPAPAGSAPASAPQASARPSGRRAGAHPRTKSHAPRRATSHATTASGASPGPANAGPRRLDDIAIEGEIPVPQVLFITARDQRRFLDADPSRYVRTSRQVADATPAPTRVIVVADTAHAAPARSSR